MLSRALPLLAAALLATAAAAQTTEPAAPGAATQAPDRGNTLQRAKARKTATADQQRANQATKPVTDRGTAPTATPTATRPMAPRDTESFHDCPYASGNDA